MQLELGVAKPVAQLGDLSLIPPIKMLPGAEQFYQRYASMLDLLEQRSGETVIRE